MERTSPRSVDPLTVFAVDQWSDDMRKFALTLLASAGVLVTGSAFAADTFVRAEQYVPADAVTQVRMVCDEYGRCYNNRGSRRVIIRQGYDDSYNYAPRERYIERRGYYDGGYYNDSPGVSVGIGGVGIGFGGNRW